MEKEISAAEANRRFSELWVSCIYVIGKPVARLIHTAARPCWATRPHDKAEER